MAASKKTMAQSTKERLEKLTNPVNEENVVDAEVNEIKEEKVMKSNNTTIDFANVDLSPYKKVRVGSLSRRIDITWEDNNSKIAVIGSFAGKFPKLPVELAVGLMDMALEYQGRPVSQFVATQLALENVCKTLKNYNKGRRKGLRAIRREVRKDRISDFFAMHSPAFIGNIGDAMARGMSIIKGIADPDENATYGQAF